MTLKKWVHDPLLLGNDPIFKGSWRLYVQTQKTEWASFAPFKEVEVTRWIVWDV